jgi:hypothetical protein
MFTNEASNLGLLFRHFPTLIFTSIGMGDSDANITLNIVRHLYKDPSITADKSIFRKIRNKEDFVPDLKLMFLNAVPVDIQKEMEKLYQDTVETFDPDNYGAWSVVKSQIDGLILSGTFNDELDYLNYVLGYCNIDKNILKTLRSTEESEIDNVFLQLASEWLIFSVNFDNNTSENQRIEYNCAVIMFWCSLLENFIYIYNPDGTPLLDSSKINRVLNNINGDTTYPIESLINLVKNNWANTKEEKKSTKWTDFYRDIAIKRNELITPDIDFDVISPDTTAIKKMVSRWRKGEATLNAKEYRSYFEILFSDTAITNTHPSYLTISLLQIMDSTQRILINSGIDKKYIAEQFQKYPLYLDMVRIRYEQYLKTGVITK